MKTQVNITGTDPQIKLATSLIEKLERSIDKMKMKSEDIHFNIFNYICHSSQILVKNDNH